MSLVIAVAAVNIWLLLSCCRYCLSVVLVVTVVMQVALSLLIVAVNIVVPVVVAKCALSLLMVQSHISSSILLVVSVGCVT